MDAPPSTREKALQINLDPTRYGTFAEIGAGQEVARWFFRVGGAAGTVAKTISAYDMAVSTALYGTTRQYVSRERLEAMLDCEERELHRQLDETRGPRTTFFVFADTVATRSFSHRENGHGWLGVRFQTLPRGAPSEIIIHAWLRGKEAAAEQEAVGILGVNLLHAAFFRHHSPNELVASLLDGLGRDRVEVDMIKLSGPAFAGIDNRLMSLQLVEQGLTDAAMFTAEAEVVQPSEVLYKRPILVERGSFRPVTNLTLDLLERARAQFLAEEEVKGEEPVVLMEMTLRGLTSQGGIDHGDFLARAEILHALGNPVLISNCDRYFSLVEILTRYSNKMIGIALGVPSLRRILDEHYYDDLAGGRLEAIGRLFKNAVKVYVYPTVDRESGALVTVENLDVDPSLLHLYEFLRDDRHLEGIRGYRESDLHLDTTAVLAALQRGDPSWEAAVPQAIVAIIRERRLFGYAPPHA
jgi:hypothetical protein